MDNIQPKGVKGDLLIVDDDLSALQTLEALLSREGYEVRGAPNGQTALMFAREDPPELVLLDIRLPDIDGFQVCRLLKADQKTGNIPVIFISGLDEVVDKVKGFTAGGIDYLTKPFQGEELLARVDTHLTVIRLQKQIEAQNVELEQEITKAKLAEEKIKRAAEEWRTTFDSIHDPVSIHDKDFRVVRVNKAFAATFGMKIGELLGKRCYEIIHATEEPWSTCPHRRTLESGKSVTEEFFEPRLGRFLQVSASSIFNDQNEVIGSVHIAKDITERKQAEKALKISETRYRRLFEAAQDGILILDADTGRITDVNPFLAKMLGYSHEDFLGKNVWEIGAFKDIEASKAAFSELQTKGYVRYEDFPLQTKDGQLIDMEFVSNVYTVNNHKVIQCNIRDITDRKRAEEALQKAHNELEERVKERTADLASAKEELQTRLREIEELKQRLEMENIYLREEIKLQYVHEEIVGRSEPMKSVLSQAEQVSRTDSTVLIQGETGTGKELLARAIHQLSARKDRPLVTVNCASLPPTLIESELFGREKGAYTGALTQMVGRFELADGSTLFLDEIGELPHDIQSKLLHVLEEGRFERLGSTKTLHVNVRIIAATNRELAQEVKEGKFRKDLFYRLNVFPIVVPPLRERPEDIPLLVWAFVKQFEKKMGKRIETIPRKSMEALQRHVWPGNVRELKNAIEHAMIVSGGRTLMVQLNQPASLEKPEARNLEYLERGHIQEVLEKTGWRITGVGGAAGILGIKRTTLQSKMKKLGIKRPAT